MTGCANQTTYLVEDSGLLTTAFFITILHCTFGPHILRGIYNPTRVVLDFGMHDTIFTEYLQNNDNHPCVSMKKPYIFFFLKFVDIIVAICGTHMPA